VFLISVSGFIINRQTANFRTIIFIDLVIKTGYMFWLTPSPGQNKREGIPEAK
jgi:hypothetical protein